MSLDVLAIGAHPDDVELGCGGTLARLAQSGRRVGILHLTGGEAGTRGTPEGRREEAEQAATALGAETLRFLDCGDGALRTGPVEEEALIEVLRELRPELVLAPAPRDRHPDHGRAHRLVVDACFYAGLRKRQPETAERYGAHRPALTLSYLQHDLLEASIVVDITGTWEAKRSALRAYRSQFFRGADGDDRSETVGAAEGDPETKVSSPEFLAVVEGRARQYGLLIGTTFGEPFWSAGPLAVTDPWHLLPGGLR